MSTKKKKKKKKKKGKEKKIDVTKSDAYLKSIVKIHEDYTYAEKIVQLTA